MKKTGKNRPGIQAHLRALRVGLGVERLEGSLVEQHKEWSKTNDWVAIMLSCAGHCSKHLTWIISSSPYSNPRFLSIMVSILEVIKLIF